MWRGGSRDRGKLVESQSAKMFVGGDGEGKVGGYSPKTFGKGCPSRVVLVEVWRGG